jgi:perosamine synthetase
MTDLQCAIGLGQLDKLDRISQKRQNDYKKYLTVLEGVGDLEFIKTRSESTFIPFRFSLKTKYKNELVSFLEGNGIQTRSFFFPLHMQPKFINYRNDGCPIARELYEVGICLPIYYSITSLDIEFITTKIIEFFHGK